MTRSAGGAGRGNRARRHPALGRGGAVTVAVAVLLTACVTDRSADLVGTGGVCGAAAELTETLVDSAGEPSADGGLVAAVDRVSSASTADTDTTLTILAPPLIELRSLADRTGELTDEERGRWYAALADLDDAVVDRCGFSMRVIVAAASTGTPPEGVVAPADDDEVAAVEGGPLTWSEILRRLPDAEWTDRGYAGVVGVGPGVFVKVYDVPTESEALAVCADILSSLAPEAESGGVDVKVLGLADDPLAQSRDGRCVPATTL